MIELNGRRYTFFKSICDYSYWSGSTPASKYESLGSIVVEVSTASMRRWIWIIAIALANAAAARDRICLGAS